MPKNVLSSDPAQGRFLSLNKAVCIKLSGNSFAILLRFLASFCLLKAFIAYERVGSSILAILLLTSNDLMSIVAYSKEEMILTAPK
jgi:hypothetical protein